MLVMIPLFNILSSLITIPSALIFPKSPLNLSLSCLCFTDSAISIYATSSTKTQFLHSASSTDIHSTLISQTTTIASLKKKNMGKCFSFTASRNWCYRNSFSYAGLKSTTTDLGDGTIMHCWVPKTHKHSKPSLLLLHGLGANAMWQWNDFIDPLTHRFNVYVPDLLFFGDSFTPRPERSESFQAQCVMGLMGAHDVTKMSVVGISYGGFVAYSVAAQFPEKLEKVVLCCAGVCLEERDMDEGLFRVKTIDEAVSILLPQTPEKMRQLVQMTFVKPIKVMPTCFLNDFIHVMCTENRHERIELVEALLKGRKQSDLPKITQPTLILWGEHDQVFPLELAHRLKRHLGENAELVVIKNAGHALNIEKPKELYKNLKSFLIDPISPSKQENNINGGKVDD